MLLAFTMLGIDVSRRMVRFACPDSRTQLPVKSVVLKWVLGKYLICPLDCSLQHIFHPRLHFT